MRTLFTTLLLFATTMSGLQQSDSNQRADAEHPVIVTSSREFVDGTPSALKILQSSDFERGLETPSLAASSAEDIKNLIGEINSKQPVEGVGVGSSDILYDVILQPGHYLRTSGNTGTHGEYVSEQALVAYMTNIIASDLRRTGESVLVVSADQYLRATRRGADFDGLRGKVFLALHADGNPQPCTTGPSLGYQKPTTVLTMNMVGLGLADALGYDYTNFRKPNFTANEAQYYMFSQVRAQRLTGLLEVGELTCKKSDPQFLCSERANRSVTVSGLGA